MINYEITAIFTPDGFILDRVPSSGKDPFFDQAMMDDFSQNKFKALFELGFAARDERFTASLAYMQFISVEFARSLSRDSDIEITRSSSPLGEPEELEFLRAAPYGVGIEFVNERWIGLVWNGLRDIADGEIKDFAGTVAEYLRSKNSSLNVVGRVFFHLVENKSDDSPFAFLATYSTGSEKNVLHLPLKGALLEYKDNRDKLLHLLSTVSRAAEKSDFISGLVESGEMFSPLRFSTDEAYTFLKEVPLYEECGVVCRIPDWWKKHRRARIAVSVGDRAPSKVGLDALLSFEPKILLGGEEMPREEVEALLTQTSGLALIKGKWVEVNHDRLVQILDAFDRAADMGDITFADAVRMRLDMEEGAQSDKDVQIEITNGEWLESIRDILLSPVKIGNLSAGCDFLAVLRHYQQIGLNWLGQMRTLGFGSLLADDMGLGKTIQILALLEFMRQNGGAKTLLVIPASLICNWQSEADKYTPKLKHTVVHSGKREFDIDEADLFITTYGMVHRLDSLKDTKWDLIVIDEAQAIKNAGTKQTKAVKTLKSTSRIAMTGTPIENSLSDLWSIFDFLNRGLLGGAKEFGGFAKKLKTDIRGYSRLREIISPFILRRLKTDKSVIADLPDKIELKAFTELTKKQVVLYSALIKDIEKQLSEVEGIARKGLVLASIMKFKQICNHPDQYLGQSTFDPAMGGKFKKLAEICETIAEKRERVLIFTQFREMTAPIADYLETLFGRKGFVLHGGTGIKKRGELVERFNGGEYVPFMVLSLKAGGTGLNLTAANHVIHFDRWWNPAVENQATDRAYRIGQSRNVLVHKFITVGTIEEKIDAMIDEKQKLAGDVIASQGEAWITEMDNEALMNLFRLEARV
jgi:non-specific serine/threonine protein kinase